MACVKDGSRLSFSAISSGRYLFSGSSFPPEPGSSGVGAPAPEEEEEDEEEAAVVVVEEAAAGP